MIGLFAKRHETPLNFILLTLFTALEAMSVASIVTFYDSRAALQAFICTAAAFIGLTAFALQTKKDFSFLWPFLSGTLMVLIVAGWFGGSMV
jgi:FtsH-binding integral membrane protein